MSRLPLSGSGLSELPASGVAQEISGNGGVSRGPAVKVLPSGGALRKFRSGFYEIFVKRFTPEKGPVRWLIPALMPLGLVPGTLEGSALWQPGIPVGNCAPVSASLQILFLAVGSLCSDPCRAFHICRSSCVA